MKTELKQKVLSAIAELKPECIVKENVYKCANDGMVCFNGFIAELVNGNKYELDDYWDQAYERARESADQYIMDDVKNDLSNWEHWDDLSEEEQNRLIDIHFERAWENYEPEVDSSEVIEIVADEISNDLENLYESNDTIREINELHYAWVSGNIDFDIAVAQVERLISEQE